MGFAFVAYATGTSGDAGAETTCATESGTLNVATGDLLVIYTRVVLGPGTLSSITDGGSNTATLNTKIACEYDREFQLSYILSAEANATATFTATWADAEEYLGIIVFQFRPDAGETVTVDQEQVSATGSGTLAATGEITTDGDDVVAVAGAWLQDGPGNEGDYEIDDVDDDGYVILGNGNPAWYRILSDTMTGTADVVCGSAYWGIALVTFKSAAAAPSGLSIPIVERYYRGLRAA